MLTRKSSLANSGPSYKYRLTESRLPLPETVTDFMMYKYRLENDLTFITSCTTVSIESYRKSINFFRFISRFQLLKYLPHTYDNLTAIVDDHKQHKNVKHNPMYLTVVINDK